MNDIYKNRIYNANDIIRESNYNRVSKQYNNIPHSEQLKQTFIQRFHNKYSTIDPTIKQTFNKSYAHRISVEVMDLYAIARIVKSVYSYNDSKIVIIYAGDSHVANYTELLRTVYVANLLAITEPIENIIFSIDMFRKRVFSDHELTELSKIFHMNGSIRSCINITQQMREVMINSLRTSFTNTSQCSIKYV